MFLAKKIGHRTDWALLATRVIVGVIFIAHGWQKYQGGADGVSGFISGFGIPGALAWPLIIVELVGGVLLLVGLLSRWAALGMAIVMLVVIFTVKADAGLIVSGGYELELGLLAGALSILLQGPGKFSVEKMWMNKELS